MCEAGRSYSNVMPKKKTTDSKKCFKFSNLHHKPTTQAFLIAIMSPRNEVFQTIPFGASSDADESLIATGDAEEEDTDVKKRPFSASSSLLCSSECLWVSLVSFPSW
jgi:hypothetical protein